jgi:hypothetical protein
VPVPVPVPVPDAIYTHVMRRWLSLLFVLPACSAHDPSPREAPRDPVAATGDASPIAAPTAGSPTPAGTPLSELDARVLLADGLRRAGYRIHHDVARPAGRVTVVLDGWDPERQVGFEYVARFAGDPPIDDEARAALGPRVLVVEPGDEAAVRAALDRFLASLPPL